MRTEISSLVFGLRFIPCFTHLDNKGELIDFILHGNSYFDNELFTNIWTEDNFSCVVGSINTGNYIKITSSDLIYSRAYTEYQRADYTEFVSVCNFIVKTLLPKAKIKMYNRIGFVYIHKPSQPSVTKKLLDAFFKESDQFLADARFSYRLSDAMSLVKKNKNDYYNVIIQIGSEASRNIIAYDFQMYFSPEYEDIRDFDLNAFIKMSGTCIEKDIYKRLDEV